MLQARLIRDRIFRLCAILGGIILIAGPASSEELRIITSYQEEVVEPMLEAFGRQHPEIRIRVLNKNTNAAVCKSLFDVPLMIPSDRKNLLNPTKIRSNK